jgi:hypothetical protein
MDENRHLDPRHRDKRSALRVLGILLLVVGGCFMAVGLISFFSAFGGFEPPRLFWCCFVGMPLLAAGIALTKFGYMGAVGRYMAGEMAPVAKDTFNYMADGTQDGIRTVARAVGEGLGLRDGGGPAPVVLCHRCNSENDADAKFCSECGAPIRQTKPCDGCGELNDPDARFCENCGARFE